MNPTKDLFQLIKSLSKAEKRYIKLASTKKNNGTLPDYIILFDALDKQKLFNEEALKKSFTNKNFVKRLPETKYYLYENILRNLRTFHSQASIDIKLRGGIDSAEILLQKKLFDHAYDVLKKASKLASFHGRDLILLEIMELETKLFAMTKNTKSLEKLIKQTDQVNLLNKHVNALRYNMLAETYYLHQTNYFLYRDQTAYKRLMSIPEEPLLVNDSLALSLHAKQSYYRIQAHYYGAICDYKNSFKARLASTKLIEQYPAYLKHHTDNYKSCIYMLLIYAAKAKKKKEFDIYYERFLLAIKKLKKESDLETTAQSIYLKNHIEIETKNEKQRIIELEKETVLVKFKKYQFRSELTELYFLESIAILYFHAGNYKECLVWLNKLINKSQPTKNLNTLSMALKLNILVHFELNNFDLLESQINSLVRFLKKHKIYFAFDRAFILTSKKLLKSANMKSEQLILQNFRSECIELNENMMERLAFYYFDFIRYLDNKIEYNSR